jgi:hypothetical protein
MTGLRIVIVVLLLIAAVRAHIPVVVYGCPLSVPLLPLAAAAAVLSAALVVLAVRLSVARNRTPRIYWHYRRTVIA